MNKKTILVLTRTFGPLGDVSMRRKALETKSSVKSLSSIQPSDYSCQRKSYAWRKST